LHLAPSPGSPENKAHSTTELSYLEIAPPHSYEQYDDIAVRLLDVESSQSRPAV
jgi:hypothetical protein